MTKRQRLSALMAVLALGCPLVAVAAQEAAPQPSPAVEVRVRVTSDGRFLDDLSLADFGLLEDGQAQTIGSLALVRNGRIAREEGIASVRVPPARSYTLLFQLVDWDPKLMEAVDYLFGSVVKPGDSLALVTPFKPYHLQRDALAQRTPEELSKSMKDVLRKDVLRGNGEYRDLISELRRLSRAIGGGSGATQDDIDADPTTDAEGGFGVEMQIDRYRAALMKMEGIRLVDEKKLLAFAGSLQPVAGQKTVVLFYQREFRPEISPTAMTRLMSLYQDNPQILGNLMDLFQLYKRERTFDVDKVKKAFAAAGIDFHFIFMEKKNQRVFGATMREQSEDTYPGFVEIAKATGGTADSSSNPAKAFKHAADTSASYYLLSYVPAGVEIGAAFRQIDVSVKRAGCLVTNPLGYFTK